MKKLFFLIVLGSTASASEIPTNVTQIVFSRTDHNIVSPNFPNGGKPCAWVKNQIEIQRNDDGKFDLIRVMAAPAGESRGPIGPLAKNMSCSIDGSTIADSSTITCIKEDDGRTDTAIIQKDSDGSYSLKRSWVNTKNAENNGSKVVLTGLGLVEFTQNNKTISFFPGNIDY